MELSEFVAEALKQMVAGVNAARGEITEAGAEINPPLANLGDAARERLLRSRDGKTVTVVDFDVAVTVVEGQNAKGGAGLFVGVPRRCDWSVNCAPAGLSH